jgi:MerR family redox-sensitive transcriptional activator SoxR
MDRVLLIRFAGDMGFTLAEIRIFLNGLSDTTPVGPRWEKLAHRKLKELETSIARSLRLRSLLRNLLRCKCASLKICVEQLRLCDDLTHVSRKRHSNRGSKNFKFEI